MDTPLIREFEREKKPKPTNHNPPSLPAQCLPEWPVPITAAEVDSCTFFCLDETQPAGFGTVKEMHAEGPSELTIIFQPQILFILIVLSFKAQHILTMVLQVVTGKIWFLFSLWQHSIAQGPVQEMGESGHFSGFLWPLCSEMRNRKSVPFPEQSLFYSTSMRAYLMDKKNTSCYGVQHAAWFIKPGSPFLPLSSVRCLSLPKHSFIGG